MLQSIKQLDLLLECPYLLLLSSLICANLADGDLLHRDLPALLLINSFVYIAKRARSYHLSQLPLSNGYCRFLSVQCCWVLFRVVTDLLLSPVAIVIVVFVKIVLVLFVVWVGHLWLVEWWHGQVLQITLLALRLGSLDKELVCLGLCHVIVLLGCPVLVLLADLHRRAHGLLPYFNRLLLLEGHLVSRQWLLYVVTHHLCRSLAWFRDDHWCRLGSLRCGRAFPTRVVLKLTQSYWAICFLNVDL